MIRKSGNRFSEKIMRKQSMIRKSGNRFSEKIMRKQALDDARHLVEVKARRAREQHAAIAITERAEKVRFDMRAGEEFAIDTVIVEARHRPAIEPERPRRHDEIGPLQRAVAEGGLGDLLRLCLLYTSPSPRD